MGAELEGSWQPHKFIRLMGAFSYGIWEYTEDVSGVYIPDESTGIADTINYFIKDLKVGDAPQAQVVVGLSVFPAQGMQAQLLWRNYGNYYSCKKKRPPESGQRGGGLNVVNNVLLIFWRE